MKEMWDYESREPFSGKARDVSKKIPEESKHSQVKPKNECELCGGNHEAEQCPHETKFSLGMDTTSYEWTPLVLTQKKNSLMVRVKV